MTRGQVMYRGLMDPKKIVYSCIGEQASVLINKPKLGSLYGCLQVGVMVDLKYQLFESVAEGCGINRSLL